MQSSSKEIAVALHRFAGMLANGESATIWLSGEKIVIPSKADVNCRYETSPGSGEFSVRVTWGLVSKSQLVRQHSELVKDSSGNVYHALVYGDQRNDGTWEGWIEFVPLDSSLSSRQTERETTQPDLPALEYWATGLEPLYLAGAFVRAN